MTPSVLPESKAAEERPVAAKTKAQRILDDSLTPLAFLTLPNLPLLLLRHKLTLLPHGIINLECLFLGIGSLFLPRLAVFFLLILEMVGAFAYEICYSFQFQFSDLLISARSVADLPALRKAECAGVLTGVVLIAALVAFGLPRPRRRLHAAIGLVALLVLVSAVDVLDGENPVFHNRYVQSDVMRVSRRLGLSPWLALTLRGNLFDRVNAVSRQARNTPMPSASAVLLEDMERVTDHRQPDIVLMLVESWGLFQDGRLRDALIDPYQDPRLRAAYDVEEGTAPFDGGTVPGEVRELCRSHLGFGILHVSPQESRQCLPRELEARGYRTYALHGYVGEMFQRDSWYRTLGFQQMWFGPDLEKQGLPACPGAFPGACGSAVARWIGTNLLAKKGGPPQFIYWVTLNSHIPVPLHPNLPADQECSRSQALRSSDALCSWFRILHALHGSVADLAVQAVQRPTIFVLVGDHAPPFANPALRVEFSDTVVPYIILTPKSLQAGPSPHLTAAHPAEAPRSRGPAVEARTGSARSGN